VFFREIRPIRVQKVFCHADSQRATFLFSNQLFTTAGAGSPDPRAFLLEHRLFDVHQTRFTFISVHLRLNFGFSLTRATSFHGYSMGYSPHSFIRTICVKVFPTHIAVKKLRVIRVPFPNAFCGFAFYLSSFIIHPSSLILHPSSFIPHTSSFTKLRGKCLVQRPSDGHNLIRFLSIICVFLCSHLHLEQVQVSVAKNEFQNTF